MTFINGDDQCVKIGTTQLGGYNALETILREQGRFIIKSPSGFIALSEKKTRNISISGSIPIQTDPANWYEYEASPTSVVFESADVFPQDLINEYQTEQLMLYGIAWLFDADLSSVPADSEQCMIQSINLSSWISRQPMSSWNDEDSINVNITCSGVPGGMGAVTGLRSTTVKKKRVPIFSPIKSYVPMRKSLDKMYLYTDAMIVGYCDAIASSDSVAGNVSVEARLIEGLGYLPEEVEELLSANQ